VIEAVSLNLKLRASESTVVALLFFLYTNNEVVARTNNTHTINRELFFIESNQII
jgi:hypothetical protein